MTIYAGNSVRIANSIIRIKGKPQNIVSGTAEVRGQRYDRRQFFCLQIEPGTTITDSVSPKRSGLEALGKQDKTCRLGAELGEKKRNCLAFRVKFYYNNGLYNVVGPWLMQGVAKLREVAEVARMTFVYLKLPHIANSKGTIVAT